MTVLQLKITKSANSIVQVLRMDGTVLEQLDQYQYVQLNVGTQN